MRKLVLLAIGFLLCSASIAVAAEKVAVFDLQKVVSESEAAKSIKSSLDSKFGVQKDALEAEIKGIRDDMTKLGDKEPSDELKKRQQQYNEKLSAFLRLFQADEERIALEINQLISNSAKTLAQSKGYAVILDRRNVAYCDPTLDITNDMLTEVNAQWQKTSKK